MRHHKSLPHQIKSIAASEILSSAAPSIFEVDDFFSQPSTSQGVSVNSTSGGSTTGGTNGGTATPQTTTPAAPGNYASLTDLSAHASDSLAHKALFDSVYANIEAQIGSIVDITSTATQLSGTIAANGLAIADNEIAIAALSGTLNSEYLKSANIIAGDNISVAAGTDGGGRPTRTIALSIEKGKVNGSINGITSGPFSAGVNYETGRVVNANLSNLSVTSAALIVDSVTSNGSVIQFYVKSGHSGTTVNCTFEIHWTMI